MLSSFPGRSGGGGRGAPTNKPWAGAWIKLCSATGGPRPFAAIVWRLLSGEINLSIALGLAGGPRKHGQMHVPPENKAQLAVELDRGTVRIEHVQERSFCAR